VVLTSEDGTPTRQTLTDLDILLQQATKAATPTQKLTLLYYIAVVRCQLGHLKPSLDLLRGIIRDRTAAIRAVACLASGAVLRKMNQWEAQGRILTSLLHLEVRIMSRVILVFDGHPLPALTRFSH